MSSSTDLLISKGHRGEDVSSVVKYASQNKDSMVSLLVSSSMPTLEA